METQNWETVLDVLAEKIVKLEGDLIKSQARERALQDDLEKSNAEIVKHLMEESKC